MNVLCNELFRNKAIEFYVFIFLSINIQFSISLYNRHPSSYNISAIMFHRWSKIFKFSELNILFLLRNYIVYNKNIIRKYFQEKLCANISLTHCRKNDK